MSKRFRGDKHLRKCTVKLRIVRCKKNLFWVAIVTCLSIFALCSCINAQDIEHLETQIEALKTEIKLQNTQIEKLNTQIQQVLNRLENLEKEKQNYSESRLNAFIDSRISDIITRGKFKGQQIIMHPLQLIPQGIWKKCWHQDGEWGWFDFTEKEWRELSVADQSKYTKAYQQWYANYIGLDLRKEISAGGTIFIMRLIPPGQFYMGSGDNDPLGTINERPKHKVLISKPFYYNLESHVLWTWSETIGSACNLFGRNSALC